MPFPSEANLLIAGRIREANSVAERGSPGCDHEFHHRPLALQSAMQNQDVTTGRVLGEYLRALFAEFKNALRVGQHDAVLAEGDP